MVRDEPAFDCMQCSCAERLPSLHDALTQVPKPVPWCAFAQSNVDLDAKEDEYQRTLAKFAKKLSSHNVQPEVCLIIADDVSPPAARMQCDRS